MKVVVEVVVVAHAHREDAPAQVGHRAVLVTQDAHQLLLNDTTNRMLL
jgi:hypothetical protein